MSDYSKVPHSVPIKRFLDSVHCRQTLQYKSKQILCLVVHTLNQNLEESAKALKGLGFQVNTSVIFVSRLSQLVMRLAIAWMQSSLVMLKMNFASVIY